MKMHGMIQSKNCGVENFKCEKNALEKIMRFMIQTHGG